jgi:hypothetical protein
MERQELERERSTLENSQIDLRNYLSQSAPVGSRWAGHPDTGAILDQINRNDARIAEIDRQLSRD